MTGQELLILAVLAVLAGAAVLLWPMSTRPSWTPAGGIGLSFRRGARGRAVPTTPSVGVRVLVPEALELVALALAGGGSLASAVAWVGQVLPGAPGDELARVAVRLEDGAPAEQAWQDAGGHWAAAERSLRLAEVAGVPPGEALVRAAADLRRDAVSDVEVASARLGVRLVLPLGLAYLPAFVLTTVVPLVLALTRDLVW